MLNPAITAVFMYTGQVQENNSFMKRYFSQISFITFFVCIVAFGVIATVPCLGQTASNSVSVSTDTPKIAHKSIETSKTQSISNNQETNLNSFSHLKDSDIEKYVVDSASIIGSDYKKPIAGYCMEIEEQARIRILVKTEVVKDLNEGQLKADGFFAEWIRSIGLDKRGILVYAILPEGSAHGKILIKVGIGLKYLISKEMGEKILNQVIIPNNAENKDGKGFLEGVLSIKRMLLDELARDKNRVTNEPKTFDLSEFLWSYKEVFLVLIIVFFFIYIIFFVERCPKCGGSLKITKEVLKEPAEKTLGLQRKIYVCEKCGLTRRKKEPIYPSGLVGLKMRLSGTRRNVRVD